MCFEVTVEAPYESAEANYQTWEEGSTPKCTEITNGLKVNCALKAGSTQVL